MVKSWVCPRCLGDLDTFYIEEGDVIIASSRVTCSTCGFTLEIEVSECFEDIDGEESMNTEAG